MPRLEVADLDHCTSLLQAGSRSFHAASRLLPQGLRPSVTVLYAFCRVADDAVDLVDEKAAALERLKARLDAMYAADPEPNPVDRAFAWLVREHRMPRALPDALLEGFAWDVEFRRYANLSEVRAYSVRVASTVGLMMTLIMGVRHPDALARACDLGVAMQLTNIARDVGEDAREGRLFLPTEALEAAGLDVEAWLAHPRPVPEVKAAVRRLLAEADRLYQRADAGIPMLPWHARFAIRAARLIYADIGRVIAENDHDSITRRAVTSGPRKLWLMGRVVARLDELLPETHPSRYARAAALEEVQALITAIVET